MHGSMLLILPAAKTAFKRTRDDQSSGKGKLRTNGGPKERKLIVESSRSSSPVPDPGSVASDE